MKKYVGIMVIVTMIMLGAMWGAANVGARCDDGDCSRPKEYLSYLPVLSDASAHPELCAAWVPSTYVQFFKNDFGEDSPYYHSASYRSQYWGNGGIPVLRTLNDDRASFYRVLKYLEENNYSGAVKLFNECDREGQDNCTPEEAVALYKLAVSVLPSATFYAPNAVTMEFTEAFFGAVGDDWRDELDVKSVHEYQWGLWDSTAVVYPLKKQATLYEIFDRLGLNHRYAIMETGAHRFNWEHDVMARFYEELFETDAEMVCVFAPYCSYPSPYQCPFDLYYGIEYGYTALNPNGQALRGAFVDEPSN